MDMGNEYLAALNAGDLNSILSLFDSNAVVVSPLYGQVPASKFYEGLLTDTKASDTHLVDVYESASNPRRMALHFLYKWTLKNRTVVEFECVDILELNQNKDKILKLKIIYDTQSVRTHFKASKGE
jgi:hypothetical protein